MGGRTINFCLKLPLPLLTCVMDGLRTEPARKGTKRIWQKARNDVRFNLSLRKADKVWKIAHDIERKELAKNFPEKYLDA